MPATGEASTDTAYAEIEDFLTDEHCRAANDCGLGITLHMVKPRALAEPTNQATIRKYCEKYPNLKMILAHAARGFNMYHTIEAIHTLAGLDNVYFDTGAICEAGGIHACYAAVQSRFFHPDSWYVCQTVDDPPRDISGSGTLRATLA